MSDVTLYNRDAQAFQISNREWQELLRSARELGWQPAGTLRPPIRLDLPHPERQKEWDGDYENACGQVVTRKDADSLTAALEARRTHLQALFTIDLPKFIRFAGQGGFLVCAPAQPSGDTGATLSLLHRALSPETPADEEHSHPDPSRATRS